MPESVAPVPPFATAIAVPFHVPEVIVPTDVREDPVTPEPSVEPDRTSVPATFNTLPDARFTCSDEVHESVASTQLKVLSVVPFNVIPPPSAPASAGSAVSPRTIFLSSTTRLVELMFVVVPLTVKSPERTRDVPVAAPIFGVTSVGVLAKTSAPVPVSSVTAEIRFSEDGVARNVATLVPRPEIPVDTGSPVAFVKVAPDGVPRSGVVNVGDVSVLFVRVCVFVVQTTAAVAPCASVAPVCVDRSDDEALSSNCVWIAEVTPST